MTRMKTRATRLGFFRSCPAEKRRYPNNPCAAVTDPCMPRTSARPAGYAPGAGYPAAPAYARSVAAACRCGHTGFMAAENPNPFADYALAVRTRMAEQVSRERGENQARRAQMMQKLLPAVKAAREATGSGRVWLFGSFAWGEPDAHSDVDLLVEHLRSPDSFAYLVGKECGVQVHAISLDAAPETLVARAMAEGIPL